MLEGAITARVYAGDTAQSRIRLSRWVLAIAAVQVSVLLAMSTRYGYHRDELYFIVAGSHAAFGYPDQPPLVPLLAWAMNALAPGSLLLLRAPSALVAGATTILSALIAGELGGGARAQVIAAGATASSGFALAVSHLVSTTTFDLLSTTVLGFLAIRAVRRASGPAVCTAGVFVGLGIEAKPQVGLVALVMVGALLAVGPREPLRTWWAAAGAAIAVALALPYLIWQGQHGWPQLTVAHNIAGSQEGGRAGFIPFQLVMVSPVLVPVWVAGLLAPFRRPHWRDLRFVSATYVVMAVLYLAGNGHAYYLASLYPILLGLGAIPAAEWTTSGRRRKALITVAIVVSAGVSAVIALPILPERDLQGSVVMAINNAQGEMVGWPQFISTVSRALARDSRLGTPTDGDLHRKLGEAGAIDLLHADARLPRAYSGHNGFSEWGIPPSIDTHALVLGYNGPGDARPDFDRCHQLAVVNNRVGLNNQEQGLPVMLCLPAAPWVVLWPRLRHYN